MNYQLDNVSELAGFNVGINLNNGVDQTGDKSKPSELAVFDAGNLNSGVDQAGEKSQSSQSLSIEVTEKKIEMNRQLDNVSELAGKGRGIKLTSGVDQAGDKQK